ncbi:MAG: GDYXXLXY domain-containing protein [Saprospiraceae bacterium]|nr:GDYXXLXY domain-containing protein [Saprospiraceae bacterium]
MNYKIIFPAFILMVVVQLYVPASLLFQNERVIQFGTEYKFKTAPIDPNDPFRGKYITLTFEETSTTMEDSISWVNGTPVYVTLTTDDAGYAKILSLTDMEPTGSSDYIKANVDYVLSDTVHTVFVRYPFDRFYMEESKAPLAEQAYNEAMVDSNQVAYALVLVQNGKAVIGDVVIDGISIQEVVKKRQRSIK